MYHLIKFIYKSLLIYKEKYFVSKMSEFHDENIV